MRAKGLAYQLHEHVIWHHWIPDEKILAEAQALVDQCHLMDAYTVTDLCKLLEGVTGGKNIGDALVDRWLQYYSPDEGGESDSSDFLGRHVHPKIKLRTDALKAKTQAKMTLYDACERMVKNGGWGSREEIVLKAATASDFELTIKTLPAGALKLFMARFLDMHMNRKNFTTHFGNATDNFVEACRNLYADPKAGRLSNLILLLFRDAKIEGLLATPMHNP